MEAQEHLTAPAKAAMVVTVHFLGLTLQLLLQLGAEAVAPAITAMVKAETAAPVVAQACTQLLPVKEQPVRVMMVACPMSLTLVRVVVAEITQ